jgi:UDP-4-amino-4-deoxy-L-arabinose-oxoglutarate aminotransferase
MNKVDFYRHELGAEELAQVGEVLSSVFLTTGPKTAEFEKGFSEYLGVPYTSGVTSCTTALLLALKAYDIGEGDEVITTPMTFIASANAILHAGAKPVFVDVEAATGNLDASRVEAAITPRTKAVVAVHLYGQMCDMRALKALADKHNLALIEDCAHAAESQRDGVGPGQLGDVACFSFYATKNITCGEGGAISTRHAEIADRIKTLRLHGMSKAAYDRYTGTYKHWDMLALGYKANMCDLQAALLLPQLGKIEQRLAQREALCRLYDELFTGVPGISTPQKQPNSKLARHLYTVWVDPSRRDEILGRLQEAGIGVAVNFRAIHLLTYYQQTFGFERGAFPNAELIGDSTITLPLYPSLQTDAVRYVAQSLIEIVKTPR